MILRFETSLTRHTLTVSATAPQQSGDPRF